MNTTFIVIGLSDCREQFFSPYVKTLIQQGKVFSGGKRHFEIVSSLLPEGFQWIDIVVPLQSSLEAYKAHKQVVVFASGDPLFFGFATTLQREFPQSEIKVYPYFNSLQSLAHQLTMPYHEMHMVSLTGRPWNLFDKALIDGEQLIGVLTDKKHTPVTIAERMLRYGYDNYTMYVGECLGNETEERVSKLSLKEAAQLTDLRHPNCLILQRTYVRKRYFGIPDNEFYLLNGRAKMITKMPIRLLTLNVLDLTERKVFWDVGFCTGSVSIEAKLHFPHLDIHSFEIREEGDELMKRNAEKFGAIGIQHYIGDFLLADVENLPRPDAVFIGGHGNKLYEILEKINQYLQPGGIIVFNSVSENSLNEFRESIRYIGKEIQSSVQITIDSFNKIEILKAQ